jgi:transcriptional regulator with XRE-family HTH domain
MSDKQQPKSAETWESMIRAAIAAWPGTRYALAKAAGVDHAQLNRFIAGEQSIGLAKAEAICRVLGLELTAAKKTGIQKTARKLDS